MGSTKMFQEFGEPTRKMMNINGPRPNSLSINQTSHAIKKNQKPNSFQKHHPIIIYTHSPKIIHADAKDFMALVQNLTGVSRRPEDKIVPEEGKGVVAKGVKYGDFDESNHKSSWIMSEENNGNDEPKYNLADFPLFTPNSSNLFCSPQSSLRANYDAISSFLEAMNGLQEY